MRYRNTIVVLSLLVTLVSVLTQCGPNTSADPRGRVFAGAEACTPCHRDLVDQHRLSNHFKTSALVSAGQLSGFISAKNDLVHYPDSQWVKLERIHGDYFQTYFHDGRTERSEKIEFAIGSAEKARTFAYWKGEQLFQLPLTYFTDSARWTNSPGYPPARPYFDRVILSRCLECHASNVDKTSFQSGPLQVSEKLSPASLVMGIDCERCHGPGAEHIRFHEENKGEAEAHPMKSIKSLSRQQQVDLCASCHSGNDRDVLRSLFSFRPGDTLDNFLMPQFGSGKEPDVHGKQFQLLRSSKCYQLSEMTCGSCHDPHRPEKANRQVYIAKCMDCHQGSGHAKSLVTAEQSCMDCHMPLQNSRVLDFNTGPDKQSLLYLLRSHRIAIYP